ncbi:DNA-binding transcriptional regulator, LysR family [Cohaesibacter sp. ES.047]|uniref:LysR family transcriptional regulator n=1 Tax=Cohaesibacter sp. ES.047 TaxID=1798205 RepID=UPI000BB6E22B|nr:LysR family transcriptional regulator [Cohaesibacter sp. ES.047]SNY89932.1 DNA-binding transcriptional regulator, LysR family [Cohaesibacter sp. ES.047]
MRPYEQRFPWNLDWNLLRTFMVVVEQKSITKTADFLGLKQPTVSAALKRLEEATGHKLIVRKPNEFKVTETGKILYNECSSIFGSVSQLPSLLERDEDELSGHIAIVVASHVVCPHFDEVLADFADRHRKVTFSIAVADSEEIVSSVLQNRISFGICLLNDLSRPLDNPVLFREFFGLYCGPRHRLFGKTDIKLSDLAGERSVSFQTEVEGGPLEPVIGLRAHVQAETLWQGVSSNLVEIRRMIVANIGIGALPVHVARRDVERGLLHQLPPYEDLPVVDVYLITSPKRRSSDAEAEFLRLCREKIFSLPLEERTFR